MPTPPCAPAERPITFARTARFAAVCAVPPLAGARVRRPGGVEQTITSMASPPAKADIPRRG